MGDTKTTQTQPNQTMQHEKAKAEVSGQQQDERDRLDHTKNEKSAIGSDQPTSQTGEPGRARNELDENQKQKAEQQS